MLKPKFYYHLTQKEWPERITLSPREDGDHRAEHEPVISRTCVAPTIEGCLVALGSCLSTYRTINIYRTVTKVQARTPYRVDDSFITKEKWIVKPIRFMKIGIINDSLPDYVREISSGDSLAFEEQESAMIDLKSMKLNFVDWL